VVGDDEDTCAFCGTTYRYLGEEIWVVQCEGCEELLCDNCRAETEDGEPLCNACFAAQMIAKEEEDSEGGVDTCDWCGVDVVVKYEDEGGYTIADCDACDARCCRACLLRYSTPDRPACPVCVDFESLLPPHGGRAIELCRIERAAHMAADARARAAEAQLAAHMAQMQLAAPATPPAVAPQPAVAPATPQRNPRLPNGEPPQPGTPSKGGWCGFKVGDLTHCRLKRRASKDCLRGQRVAVERDFIHYRSSDTTETITGPIFMSCVPCRDKNAKKNKAQQ